MTENSFALSPTVCLVLVKQQIFEKLVSLVDTYSFTFCKCMEMVLHEKVKAAHSSEGDETSDVLFPENILKYSISE